ncbi:unnamed protein product [Lactuca virosa]|uniref:TRF2/HOY1 PH-like domain-containing protein n=1 Tax=Lactuca virosa TaxID=75947 RepID=A0AAU9PK81_9ASTR|nr:unnamed protein product [Lactuca virosa]
MASCSKTRNPYQFCNDDEQDKDEDEYRSKNNSGFLHDYPSHHSHHHPVHVQTSNNGVVLAESTNDHQFLTNNTTHNQVQEGSQVVLTLRISDSLIKQLELALTQEKQQNNHQELLSQPQPPRNLKASNVPAIFLKIGTWKWESKNPGDLVVKFYYKKKKLVWEFLFGPMKKKIEISWTHVSAINAYVDEDKNGRLEIELENPPEYHQECKFQRLKHTRWEKTDDFTLGQAQFTRRHTVLFSPGVLDEHFEKLLQYDNRLLNISRQPFPISNSMFFNPNMEFSYNESVYRCPPIPLSSYNHQETVIPSVDHLMQPTSSSYVGHSGSNLPMPGLTFANSGDIPSEVSYVNEETNGVGEQSPNNQIKETPFPPIREQDDYEPYEALEPIISDQQLQLNPVNNQNPTQLTADLNCLNIDSNSKSFEQNQHMNLNPYGNRESNGNVNHVGELHINPADAFTLDDYLTDDLSTGDDVENQMALDYDFFSFGEQQLNDVFGIQEPFSQLSSQLNDNNGGYGGLPLHGSQLNDNNGGYGELPLQGSNSMGCSLLENDIEDKI